jgi:hypothetical protein
MGRAPWVVALAIAVVTSGCAYRAQRRASAWLVVETEHIRLRTNVSQARARDFASELQRVRDALSAVALRCAAPDSSQRLQVTLLRAEEFQEILPVDFVGGYRQWSLSWLADYEKQVLLPDDLDIHARQVYQHELAHHLIAACLPETPLWLGEGLATFLQTALVKGDKVTLGLPPYVIVRRPPRNEGRHLGVRDRPRPSYEGRRSGVRPMVLWRRSLPPLRRLVTLGSDDFYRSAYRPGTQAEANYAAAWALVHMLRLGGGDLRARFLGYLQALRSPGADTAAAFEEAFAGVDLQRRLDAYVESGRLPTVARAVAVPRRAAPRIRLMPSGEAHVHRAWLWWDAPDRNQSRERMRQHLAAARREPSSRARARVLYAAVLAIAGDMAAAERQVAQGLRSDPSDPALLHAHAELLIRRGADASATADRLRRVTRTADQLCTVAFVDLARGRVEHALRLAGRGLAMQPGSQLCRRCVKVARAALAERPRP